MLPKGESPSEGRAASGPIRWRVRRIGHLLLPKRRYDSRLCAMGKGKLSTKPRNVRNAIKKDVVQFAVPALIVWVLELGFLARDGLGSFWVKLWGLITHPVSLFEFPVLSIVGLLMTLFGLVFLAWGQITLFKSYSGTLVIRENHQLIRHGIYSYVRNPMYFGLFLVVFGLPAYVPSLSAFLVSLLMIPIVLNRMRLEEALLTEHFQDEYQKYKSSTKRLIPFVY